MIFISLRKHKLQVIIMIVFMVLSFISMGVVFTHKAEANDATAEFKDKYIADENGYKHFYAVIESLTDDELNEYMKDDGTLYKKLESFIKVLQEQKDFKYIPVGTQSLSINGPYTNDIFTDLYEWADEHDMEKYINDYKNTGIYDVKTMSVPTSFFKEFSIEIDEGEIYKDGDGLLKEGEKIPLVLGKAYKDYYEIGDTISAYYVSGGPYTFEVKGFLESNSFFYNFIGYNDFVSCERFIFMPNLQSEDLREEVRISLLSYLCGIIDTNLSHEEITKQFNDIKKQCGLTTENIFVNEMQLSNSEMMGDEIMVSEAPPILQQYALMTDSVSKQYAIIAFIVLGFGFSTMLLLMCGVIRDSFYRFGVQMLCGVSKGFINRQVTAMGAIPVFVADAAATIALMSMGADLRAILILQSITISVITVSSIILIFYLNKLNIQKIIGKE